MNIEDIFKFSALKVNISFAVNMDNFFIRAKRKVNEEEPCSSTDLQGYESKTQKYGQSYLNLNLILKSQ